MTVQGRQGATYPSAEGVILCTSTTHPLNPYIGMRIYETDTGKELTFVGATMQFQPPWNTAWGVVGQAQAVADQATITTAVDVTSCTVTWTTVANRRYLITASALVQNTTAASAFQLLVTDATPTTKKLAQIHNAVINSVDQIAFSYHETGIAAGSVTRKLRALAAAGSGTIKGTTTPTEIVVTDVGSNGVPS